jgi:two-component system phosphate regulon sensor histidine kinase PhoR
MAIFTVFQITALNENERVITEIYDKQLEAILFSVNQYSQDLIDAWAGDIDDAEQDSLKTEERMVEFLLENEAVSYILWSDSSLQSTLLWSLEDQENSNVKTILTDSLKSREEDIARLRMFQKEGYLRKEPLGRLGGDSNLINQSGLIFMLEQGSRYQICLLVLDPQLFITQTLAQKIQSVAQQNFIISAYDDVNNVQITVLDSIAGQAPQKRPLWLLPDYSLGIVLKGETIQNLARERTFNNLMILLGVDLILLIGLWMIYRNIRKEIRLAQIKSDFVSNVSHEIRTPLSLISMFAETLEMNRAANEEKKQEYYSIIRHEANRLASIVNKILSFSKMEAGKVNYDLEPTNLNEVVDDILRTYDYHLTSQGFSCKFGPAENLPMIATDQNAVSEALINLLDNAIKYSNGSKEIEVNVGKEGQNLFIEVKDQGLGIEPEDQKYIFDKFYRVPTGAVHNTKGTGLGLTLVWRIMEAHGGSVEVDSQKGKGSTFRLIFPIAQEYNLQKT